MRRSDDQVCGIMWVLLSFPLRVRLVVLLVHVLFLFPSRLHLISGVSAGIVERSSRDLRLREQPQVNQILLIESDVALAP